MFQSVRPNSPIYVLHKGDSIRLETGYVVNQPVPKPKYQIPHTFGTPQEMIVDLVVKLNDSTVNYNSLPAQSDISDSFSNGESIVISDSREAMNAEMVSAKQKSLDIINSIDFHKKLVAQYDKLMADFNPEMAEKQAQQQEIAELRKQIDQMSKNMGLLVEQFKHVNKYEQNVGN